MNTRTLVIVLAVAAGLIIAWFLFVRTANATFIKPDFGEKSVEVVEDCEDAVKVTVNGGDTRRTWKVEGVEHFVDFGESHTFDATSVDVEVFWKHKGEFVLADEEYVTRTEATDCQEPSPEPTQVIFGLPGDGKSDGRSDGHSSCPECTQAPDVPEGPPATGFGPSRT